MVNPGEASVNVVTQDKPKMLLKNGFVVPASRRLQNQAWAKKARGQVRGLRTPPTQMRYHRRRDATYTTLSVPPAKRGKPVVLLATASKGSRKMTWEGSG
jgi:hypothetical protein